LTVDGDELTPRTGFGVTTAFDIEQPGTGVLTYQRDTARGWWLASQMTLWVALLVLAAGARSPFARRRAASVHDETLIDFDDRPPATDDTGGWVVGEALVAAVGDGDAEFDDHLDSALDSELDSELDRALDRDLDRDLDDAEVDDDHRADRALDDAEVDDDHRADRALDDAEVDDDHGADRALDDAEVDDDHRADRDLDGDPGVGDLDAATSDRRPEPDPAERRPDDSPASGDADEIDNDPDWGPPS
jgi:hypothetical protein